MNMTPIRDAAMRLTTPLDQWTASELRNFLIAMMIGPPIVAAVIVAAELYFTAH
jgi:hypothetical protein